MQKPEPNSCNLKAKLRVVKPFIPNYHDQLPSGLSKDSSWSYELGEPIGATYHEFPHLVQERAYWRHKICTLTEKTALMATEEFIGVYDFMKTTHFETLPLCYVNSLEINSRTTTVLIGGNDYFGVFNLLLDSRDVQKFELPSSTVDRAVFHRPADERAVVVRLGKSVLLFDIEKGSTYASVDPEPTVNDLSVNPSRNLLAFGLSSPNIHLFDPRLKSDRMIVLGDIEGTESIAFCGSDLLAAGGMASKVRIWDLRTLKLRDELSVGNTIVRLLYDELRQKLFSFELSDTFHAFDLRAKGVCAYYTGFSPGSICFSPSCDKVYIGGNEMEPGILECNLS